MSTKTRTEVQASRAALGVRVAELIAMGLTVRAAATALGLANHMQAYSALREAQGRPIRLTRRVTLDPMLS